MAVFLLGIAVAVVPVVIENRRTADPVSGVQAAGGMNFYIGNSPLHDGTAWARPGGLWDATRGMAWREGVRGAAAEDRFFVRQTLREIGSEPMAFARLTLSKALWLIQHEEIRDSHSFHFFAAASPILRWLPGFGVAFALAMCGVVATARKGRTPWLIATYAILMAATFVLLVAGSRYRMPLMPALFVYAGAGVAAAVEALAHRRTRAVATLAAVFAAGLLASHVRTHEQSHDFSEELAMTSIALRSEGRLDEAVQVARRAVTLNPRRDAAWVALGDIKATRDRWAEAEQAWRQAIAIDPRNARAWSHLGLAHIRRGDRAAAEAALLRALSIRDDDEASHNLRVLRGQAS